VSSSPARLAAAQEDLSRCLTLMLPLFPPLAKSPPALTVEPGSKQGNQRRTTAREVVLWADDDLACPVPTVLLHLAHQLVHVAHGRAQLSDCSARSYHNIEFKCAAEGCGLVVARRDRRWGWAETTPGASFLAFCQRLPAGRVSLLGREAKNAERRRTWNCGPTPTVEVGYHVLSRSRAADRQQAADEPSPAPPAPRYRLVVTRDPERDRDDYPALDRDDYPVLSRPRLAAQAMSELLKDAEPGAWAVVYTDERYRVITADTLPATPEPQARDLVRTALRLSASVVLLGRRSPGEDRELEVGLDRLAWNVEHVCNWTGLRLVDALLMGDGGTCLSTREERWGRP
jgi:hypothetical protein